jgi:hypothetical protein
MKTFLNFRNNLSMLYKCLPDSELKSVMRWRWWLDYIAAWEMLILKRNVGDFKAVYKARRAFRRWQKDFEADEAGLVPRDLPREVLSEDALYNLLADADEMLASEKE